MLAKSGLLNSGMCDKHWMPLSRRFGSCLELVVPADARLPIAARLADGAVVVVAGDVRLVDAPLLVCTCGQRKRTEAVNAESSPGV